MVEWAGALSASADTSVGAAVVVACWAGSRSRARWRTTVFSTAQVLPDVPAVRDMNGVRGAEPSGLGTGGGAIAADHLDAGVVSKPLRHRRGGPVR